MARRIVIGVFSVIVFAGCAILAMLNWRNLGELACVQSGDIYIKELPQGQPVRLTQDGLNSSPRISPSGKWLVFRKDEGQLWIMKSDGESAGLVHSGKVRYFKWAPGSDLLAFIAEGELRIWEAGTNESRLIVPSPPQEHATADFDFLWSPDGKWIAYEYTERRDVPEGKREWPWRQSIRKVNVNTGESEEIIAYPPPDQEGRPGNTALAAWVGSRIYLWQCEIMSASIMSDGCPLFYIDRDKKQKDAGVVSLLYRDFLAFSPHGEILAVSQGGNRFTWTNKRIETINLETGGEKVLTEPELAAFSPAWSPDGSLLAIVAGPDIGSDWTGENEVRTEMSKRRIWLMKADGSEQKRLTPDDGYREECPMWLADGKHIIFARFDAQSQPSVWLVRDDGKSLQKVTDSLSARNQGFEYHGHFEKEKLYDFSTATPGSPVRKTWIAITAALLLVVALVAVILSLKQGAAGLQGEPRIRRDGENA